MPLAELPRSPKRILPLVVALSRNYVDPEIHDRVKDPRLIRSTRLKPYAKFVTLNPLQRCINKQQNAATGMNKQEEHPRGKFPPVIATRAVLS